jgi:hypothetical protein
MEAETVADSGDHQSTAETAGISEPTSIPERWRKRDSLGFRQRSGSEPFQRIDIAQLLIHRTLFDWLNSPESPDSDSRRDCSYSSGKKNRATLYQQPFRLLD